MSVDAEIGDFSYEPFTRHGFYRDVNRSLVEAGMDLLHVGGRATVVDLSCGTGAMTEMLVDGINVRRIDGTVLAADPSPSALAEARRRLAGRWPNLRFAAGEAADLAATLDGPADALFFGNAIHLVADKDRVVGDIARALAPGGVLAFNSTFFDGAYPAGTEQFYRRWTVHAIRRLRREHPEVRLARGRDSSERRWWSADEYVDVLRRHGFTVRHLELRPAEMTLESFQDIGRYRLFIEGALPGAPLGAGAAALVWAAAEAFADLELHGVPRYWLEVVATARGGED